MFRRRSSALVLATLLWIGSASGSVWPNEVDRIEQGIQSEDIAERRAAAQSLVRLPESSAERLVYKTLGDDDVEVRIAVAEAILRFRIKTALPTVIKWLSERESRLRLVAARVLAEFPSSPESVQALSRTLSDPDVQVRIAAAGALGSARDSRAAMALLGHLDETNLQVQLAVLEALHWIRDPSSVVPLVGKIQDSRPPVREAVARALGVFGGERVSAALVLLLRDGNDAVRLAAVSSLGRIGAGDAIDALTHVLESDQSLDVRVAVIGALVASADEKAASWLVELLDAERRELAGEAKLALARMGEVAAPALFACLSGQPSRRRADACAYALARATREDAAAALSDAWRRRVISADAALEAFAALGDQDALPIVLESLTVGDPWVRRRAMLAAKALLDPDQPDGRAVEPLLEAARKAVGRHEEQLLLVELLGRTGATRVAPELAKFARSSRLRLRLAAIHALGLVRATSEQPLLLEALNDEHPSVRREAALALRRAGSPDAVRPLVERLDRASLRDAPWVALAMAGPLSKTTDAESIAVVEERLRRSPGAVRDALIEGLGRVPEPLGGAALVRVAERSGPRSRAKVAEALAAFPERREFLYRLLGASSANTRANAYWSLGFVGVSTDLERAAKGVEDADVRVAANAVASWGRLAERFGYEDHSLLCDALQHARAEVRANGLAALLRAGGRCGERERWMLAEDPLRIVRLSAARLLATHPRDATDREALERCFDEERDGRVARSCAAPMGIPAPARRPVTVFVFGAAGADPEAGAPFVLEFADGTYRYGAADRRGAVSETTPPEGELRLEVPLVGHGR